MNVRSRHWRSHILVRPLEEDVVQLSDTPVLPPQFINLAAQHPELAFIADELRHTLTELRIQGVEFAQVRHSARCETLGDFR